MPAEILEFPTKLPDAEIVALAKLLLEVYRNEYYGTSIIDFIFKANEDGIITHEESVDLYNYYFPLVVTS